LSAGARRRMRFEINIMKIPNFLRPFLWSYDLKKLDLEKNKEKIIFNILNFGNKKATDWLFKVYSKKEIIQIFKKIKPRLWQRRSYNFWKIIFEK
jgi:hypothetical protein